MIIRNEIPLLEYDDSSSEDIPPDHDWTAGKLPEKCFFAFLGDVVHKYAKAHDATAAETLITVSYDITIYVLHEDVRTSAWCSHLSAHRRQRRFWTLL